MRKRRQYTDVYRHAAKYEYKKRDGHIIDVYGIAGTEIRISDFGGPNGNPGGGTPPPVHAHTARGVRLGHEIKRVRGTATQLVERHEFTTDVAIVQAMMLERKKGKKGRIDGVDY